MVEGFTLNSTAGNSASVGGPLLGAGRHRRSGKKLRVVTKKVARRHLKKLGMKLRGGDPNAPVVVDSNNGAPAVGGGVDGVDETGGRRRRRGRSGKKSTKRRGRLGRMFGL
jgi:hypothetical protein